MGGIWRLWIDGGTTNTRFTLTHDETVVERSCRRVGATNADISFHNTALSIAVANEIAALERRHSAHIECICASGMITSQNGLIEVPHLPAPAGLCELARGVKTTRLMEVSQIVPFDLIPGIRCGKGCTHDVMRGEETEIMGWQEGMGGNRLFLHFGSHNKAILVKNGRIERSVTTLSGELLYAITHQTIVRSAVGGEPPGTLRKDAAAHGYEVAARRGAARALFEARLYASLEGKTSEQVYSYLVGVLAQQDMLAFEPLFAQNVDEMILYGRELFVSAFLMLLPGGKARAVSYEQSEWLSLQGMQKIMRIRAELA